MNAPPPPAPAAAGSLAPPVRRLGYVLKRFPRISETFVVSEMLELERLGEHLVIFAISRPEEPFVHAFVGELRAEVVYLPHRPLGEPQRVLGAALRAVRAHPLGVLRAAGRLALRPRAVRVRRLAQALVLRDEADRRGIDHLHAHFATSAAQLAALTRQLSGPTYSATAHAKDIHHADVRPAGLREKLNGATFVATVSEANRLHLERVLGAGTRVELIPNSVDLTRMAAVGSREPRPGLVLCVARLIEKKGHADLIDAAALLGHDGLDVGLEFVGDGALRDGLVGRARDAGVALSCRGSLPYEEVLDQYRGAAVFCLPCVVASTGDMDGLPTSLLEAMALGVPVVSTRVNGIPDAVEDEVSGLLVAPGDPTALAAALRRVLTDAALARTLTEGAVARVRERFATERSAALLRDLFPSRAA